MPSAAGLPGSLFGRGYPHAVDQLQVALVRCGVVSNSVIHATDAYRAAAVRIKMNARDCISRISDLTGRLEVLKQAAENASGSGADIDQGIDDVLNDLLKLHESFDGEAVPSGDLADRREDVLAHRRVFSLLNVLPGLVFLVDRDYRIRFANHTFLDSFTDPRDMCCFEVVHGRDAVCEDCLLQEVFAEQEPRSWQWNTQDGKHFRIFGYPFSDVDNSQLVLLLGVDLTEQTRAAAALARNEYWLRTIMDNSGDGINICRLDREGNKRSLVMCNKRFVEMSGYSLEDLMRCDDITELTENVEDPPYEQTGVFRGRGASRWKRPDGRENFYEWSASLIEMGGQQYTVGVDRDITERLKAEREFKEAKDRLQNIIDFLPDAAYVIDSSKRVIAWNREMERIYGVKAEDIVGVGDYAYGLAILGRKGPTLIDLITDDSEELRSRYDYVRERGPGVVAETYSPLAYGGRGAFLWMTAGPLRDSENNIVGAIECIRDVTDHRKAAEQLETSEAAERAFRHQLEVLHQINLELTSAESLQECCRRAVELSCEKLGFGRMGIWFKVSDDPLRFRGSFGVDENGNVRDESESVLDGSTRAADLMSGKISIWVSDDADLKDDHGGDVGTGGVAAAALLDRDKVLGFISVDNLLTHKPITPQQTELLRLLAADLGHLCARKRVEETLHEREKWVSLVMEHSTDGINICRIDPKRKRRELVMCNDQYVEMSGYTREQLMNTEDLDAMMDVIYASPGFMERVLSGGSDRGMDSWIRPDGKENYHEWTAAPIEIDGVMHIIGIDRDITERLGNERALKQSEESERAFRKQLQVLHEIILDLTKIESVEELCRKVVECGHDRLGFDGISVFLRDKNDPNMFRGIYGIDEAGKVSEFSSYSWVMMDGDEQHRVLEKIDQAWCVEDEEVHDSEGNVLGTRMRAGGAMWDSQDVFGVVTLNNWLKLEPITQQQVELVRMLAAELGHLIIRTRAEKALQASEESERVFRQQLQVLHEVILDLAKAESVDELCRKTVELGHGRLGFDGISIYFVSEDNPLEFVGTYGIDHNGELWDIHDRRFTVGPCAKVVLVMKGEAREWLVDDSDLPPGEPWGLEGPFMRAGAAMWDSHKAFGILTINNWNTLEPITPRQVEIVRLLSADVGHLIVRQRAQDKLHASEESERAFRKKLEILHEVSIELAKADSITELCRRTVELGRNSLGFDRLGLWLAGDQPRVFTGTFGTDENGNTVDEWGVEYTARDEDLSMQVLSQQLSVAIVHRDTASDSYFETSSASMRALAPLWDGEKAVGYLATDNLIAGTPITDEQGELLKLMALTAGYLYTRKLAEQALRESERWLRLVMEHSSDGINVCKIDPETNRRELVMCNDQYVEMSGFSREELFATGNLDVLSHMIERGEMMPGLEDRRLCSSGLDAWERPDGKENCHEWTAAPLEIDGQLHIIGVDRDVTERLKSEKDMRIKDSAIADAVSPIAIVSLDRIVNYVNQSFMDLWGYDDESQVIGMSVEDIYTIRAQRDEVKQIVLDTGHWSGEVQGIRKDGTNFDAHIAISLVSDKNGEPICGMASFLDITERRELERQVMEVGILERQKVGHDLHDSLGQILTGVGFLAKSLQEKLDRKSLPEAADAARIAGAINESIHQARSLARGLQPVRLEAGGLMDALREFADNTSRLFGIACVFQCKNQVLIADNVTASHVYHIAQEAVNNAFRHGKAGNIIIDLDIDVDEVTLRITDDGRGMPQDITDSKGIGMRTMNYRAAMIGGVLEIQSDRQEGTSVICTFRAPEAHR